MCNEFLKTNKTIKQKHINGHLKKEKYIFKCKKYINEK